MATIPAGYLRTLSDAMNALSEDARALAFEAIQRFLATASTESLLDLADGILDLIEPIIQALTNETASLSAASYDFIRTASTGSGMGAVPYPDHDPSWTRDAVYSMATARAGNVEAFVQDVLARIDYEGKRAAGTTQFANGSHDSLKPRFARVPTGSETCPFCIMLASRGFVYLSENTAGKLDHYHAHCDCRVVPSFGGETYEDYDPDEYLREYERLMDDGELDPDALARSAANAKRRRRIP